MGPAEGSLLAKRAERVIARRGFEIVEERTPEALRLWPLGALTAHPSFTRPPLLRDAVDRAAALGHRRIVIDLQHVSVAAPLAFGLLLPAARRLEAAGGALALYGAGPAVGPTLDLFDRRRCGPRGLEVFAVASAAFAHVKGWWDENFG